MQVFINTSGINSLGTRSESCRTKLPACSEIVLIVEINGNWMMFTIFSRSFHVLVTPAALLVTSNPSDDSIAGSNLREFTRSGILFNFVFQW